MADTKHSPGPWRTPGNGNVLSAPTGQYITSVPRGKGAGASARRDANARLIAAAPELLSALEELLRYAESRVEDLRGMADAGDVDADKSWAKADDALSAGRAAIAKAKGEP